MAEWYERALLGLQTRVWFRVSSHLTFGIHNYLGVVDRWPATSKRARHSALIVFSRQGDKYATKTILILPVLMVSTFFDASAFSGGGGGKKIFFWKSNEFQKATVFQNVLRCT